MFEVQKYLNTPGNSLATLEKEFALNIRMHPELPLAILNYDTIESKPRNHPIVRECRALTLHSRTKELVARAFERFFNVGEYPEEMELFNWHHCEAQSKEDGSLFLLYNFNNKWMVSTRGSFATDKLQFSPYTWAEIFEIAIGCKIDAINLDPQLTYVFELVSPYNKIVRSYKEPAVYLLSAFRGYEELTSFECDYIVRNKAYKMLRPKSYHFRNIDEVHDHIDSVANEDATYEGIVIRDKQNRRWKVKNPIYLTYHAMKGESGNLFNPKYQIDFMFGEDEEMLAIFPEVKEDYAKNKQIVVEAYKQLCDTWRQYWQMPTRKEFAQTVISKTKFASILFTLRDQYGDNQNEEFLEKEWRNSKKIILRNLFDR